MYKAIEAMGAKLAKKQKIDILMGDDNYVGQVKIDGFRISAEKREGKVKIFGKGSGKYDSRTEYTAHLPHIVHRLENSFTRVGTEYSPLPDDTIIDGEAVFLDDEGNADYIKTSNVMGSLPERAILLQQERGWLHFKVFDTLEYMGKQSMDAEYMTRNSLAMMICDDMNFEYMHYVPLIYGTIAKKELLDTELAAGREGIMLKNLDSKYIPGKKRENTWYKIKAEFDADVIIIGYTEPDEFTQVMRNGKKLVEDGKPVMTINRYFENGWIGSLIVGQFVHEDSLSKEQLKYIEHVSINVIDRSNGAIDWSKYMMKRTDGDIEWTDYLVPVGRVSSGLADEMRGAISVAREQYIGKVVEIKYFKRTDDSYYLPRFYRFRDEKSPIECIWGE